MSKSSTSRLTASAFPAVPQPRLDPRRVLGCAYGHYPWDDWQRWAQSRGLAADLAGLGRQIIREAYQHDWPDNLRSLCGWRDDGWALLAFALAAPQRARRQWETILRTDGLRGDYPPRRTEWAPGFLRADAQRLLDQLSSNDSPPNERTHAPNT